MGPEFSDAVFGVRPLAPGRQGPTSSPECPAGEVEKMRWSEEEPSFLQHLTSDLSDEPPEGKHVLDTCSLS